MWVHAAVIHRSTIKILLKKKKETPKYSNRRLKQTEGIIAEAQVQVTKLGNSHLVTSEAASQETLFAPDRGADFSWNIYLHLGPCAYFLCLSRWGWCEITTAHLCVTLPPMSLKTSLKVSVIRSTWIPSPRCCLSGQNVIKGSRFWNIYHNRASNPTLSGRLMERKETTVCVYLFKLTWTHFKIKLDLERSSFFFFYHYTWGRTLAHSCPWKSSQNCSLFKVGDNMISHLMSGESAARSHFTLVQWCVLLKLVLGHLRFAPWCQISISPPPPSTHGSLNSTPTQLSLSSGMSREPTVQPLKWAANPCTGAEAHYNSQSHWVCNSLRALYGYIKA